MSNPIDEYFKSGLEEIKITPNPDLWRQKIAPKIERKTKPKLPVWRIAASVVILISGWFAFDAAQQPIQPPIEIEQQNFDPVLLPEVAITAPQTHNEQAPVAAEKKQTATKKVQNIAPKQHKVALENTTQLAQAIPTVDEPKNQPASVTTKKSYGVKMRINTEKYTATTPEKTSPNNVNEYAKQQWENVKKREGIEAPPKEWFALPKIALRVEGNPLKAVLPGSTKE